MATHLVSSIYNYMQIYAVNVLHHDPMWRNKTILNGRDNDVERLGYATHSGIAVSQMAAD